MYGGPGHAVATNPMNQYHGLHAHAQSPRGRTAVGQPKGSAPPPGQVGVPLGGTSSTGRAAPSIEGPVDFEFVEMISEILRLVEQGCSANSDTVREKVEQLQSNFARAKAALDTMQGAELTPQMQEDLFDLYQKRLKHLRGMMAEYSQLPVFDEAASS